jgi:hypothetical protein
MSDTTIQVVIIRSTTAHYETYGDKVENREKQMNLIDKIFKIGMLIVAIAFVYVYFLSVQNNRYQFFSNTDEYVFDTRTGFIYVVEDDYTVGHYDLKNNKITHGEIEEHFPRLQKGTYEGKQGWYDKITSMFYPEESLQQVTHHGKKVLLNAASNKFYEVEKK